MRPVKVTVKMERTLYLDVPDDLEEEKFINIAKNEIILPSDVLLYANSILKKLGIKIDKNLDIEDWEISELNYTT